MFDRSKIGAAALLALGAALPAAAQDVQRVEITGSNIRRTAAETTSPLQVITSEQLKASGYTSAQDVLHDLTANGQGTLSQGFSGAFATGAAGVALRGLTVGATLVLIDGHRMAPYPIGDDGQRSFVDISKIPFDAVERIEVLKDGASAVYGSDAIAGVINIILKKSFRGTTISGNLGTSTHNDGQTAHIAGTWGLGDLAKDGQNFYIAAEARKQRPILYAQRPGLLTQTDFTATGGYNTTLGQSYPLVPNPQSATGYVRDAAGTKYFMPGCDPVKFAAGQCTFSDTWSQVQVPTENLNLITRYTRALSENWELSLQGSYFRGKAEQTAGPGSARTNGFQGITSGPGVVPQLLPVVPRTTIPSTNPSFPASAAAAGLTVGNLTYTFLDLGARRTLTDSAATRLIADLQGTLGSWDLSASIGFTEVSLDLTGLHFINPRRLQTALDRGTDPYLVGQPNSDAVKAFIAPELKVTDTSKLNFVHLGAGTELARLPGGALAVAFGVDYYERKQDGRAPQDIANGLLGGFSNNFTIGTQKVGSVYTEWAAPVSKTLQLEAALRYDRYNISGGKASPKAGFKFTPMKELALRGTLSRGFRAPGPAENGISGQTFVAGATNDPVLCPDGDPTTVGNFPTQCSVAVGSVQSTRDLDLLHPGRHRRARARTELLLRHLPHQAEGPDRDRRRLGGGARHQPDADPAGAGRRHDARRGATGGAHRLPDHQLHQRQLDHHQRHRHRRALAPPHGRHRRVQDRVHAVLHAPVRPGARRPDLPPRRHSRPLPGFRQHRQPAHAHPVEPRLHARRLVADRDDQLHRLVRPDRPILRLHRLPERPERRRGGRGLRQPDRRRQPARARRGELQGGGLHHLQPARPRPAGPGPERACLGDQPVRPQVPGRLEHLRRRHGAVQPVAAHGGCGRPLLQRGGQLHLLGGCRSRARHLGGAGGGPARPTA
jgi:outer membrane receptor protein involved in Fe transport